MQFTQQRTYHLLLSHSNFSSSSSSVEIVCFFFIHAMMIAMEKLSRWSAHLDIDFCHDVEVNAVMTGWCCAHIRQSGKNVIFCSETKKMSPTRNIQVTFAILIRWMATPNPPCGTISRLNTMRFVGASNFLSPPGFADGIYLSELNFISSHTSTNQHMRYRVYTHTHIAHANLQTHTHAVRSLLELIASNPFSTAERITRNFFPVSFCFWWPFLIPTNIDSNIPTLDRFIQLNLTLIELLYYMDRRSSGREQREHMANEKSCGQLNWLILHPLAFSTILLHMWQLYSILFHTINQELPFRSEDKHVERERDWEKECGGTERENGSINKKTFVSGWIGTRFSRNANKCEWNCREKLTFCEMLSSSVDTRLCVDLTVDFFSEKISLSLTRISVYMLSWHDRPESLQKRIHSISNWYLTYSYRTYERRLHMCYISNHKREQISEPQPLIPGMRFYYYYHIHERKQTGII